MKCSSLQSVCAFEHLMISIGHLRLLLIHLVHRYSAVDNVMPFFVKSEAGSAVSELLDERLERLQLQLAESQRSCEGLVGQVDAFTRSTRQMCLSAGNAVSAFGMAIQVDSTRRSANQKSPAAEAMSALAVAEGFAAGSGSSRRTTEAEKGERRGSREPMRAELLALELSECANEMEDHLQIQVLQPIERVLASRNSVQTAIRERSRASDALATAHNEYARAVSRCVPHGDAVSGGPPSEVVKLGDKVVAASDTFADKHGRAEEALSGFLEERGRCLRDAMSSLKAAQAGFFVRASRSVSSSVGPEVLDEVPVPAPQEEQHNALSRAEDTSRVPTFLDSGILPPLVLNDARDSDVVSTAGGAAAVPWALNAERDGAKEDGGRTTADSRTTSFTFGIDDRSKAKGKRHGRTHSDSKRRRSSGWFRRLTSTFQPSRPRSASDELHEGMPSSLFEGAEDGDTEEHQGGEISMLTTLSTAARSTAKSLFSADSDRERDTFKDKDVPLAGDSEAATVTASSSDVETTASGAEVPAPVVEASRDLLPEVTERGLHNIGDSHDGGGVEAEADDSDYETGSNTTEGFGSDDAGKFWDGGKSQEHSPVKLLTAENDGRDIEVDDGHAYDGRGVERGDGESTSLPGNSVREDTNETVESSEGQQAAAEAGVGSHKPDTCRYEVAFKAAASAESRSGVNRESDGSDAAGLVHAKDSSSDGDDKPPPSNDETSHVLLSPISRASRSLSSLSPTPASVLPAVPETEPHSPLPSVRVMQQTESPLPKEASPAISDASSSKESPRAWRLSWWARASDRHRPPPPASGSGDDEEAGTAESCVAFTLAAAAAGGEEAATLLSAGEALAPSVNVGDLPAAVDRGDGVTIDASGGGCDDKNVSFMAAAAAAATAATVSPTVTPAAEEAEAAAIAAAVSAERRARKSLRRRGKVGRPWLSAEKLVHDQARPLEAASEYLDVVGLTKASGICHAWRDRLGGKGASRQWMRCVRLPAGVPDKCRAQFYLHILYDQPSWVPQAQSPSSMERPRPGVFRDCLEQAEAEEDDAAKVVERERRAAEDRDGRSSREADISWKDSGPLRIPGVDGSDDGVEEEPLPTPIRKSYKWLDEIETDVLRTCPPDAVEDFDRAFSRSPTGVRDGVDGVHDGVSASRTPRDTRKKGTTISGDSNGMENGGAPVSGRDEHFNEATSPSSRDVGFGGDEDKGGQRAALFKGQSGSSRTGRRLSLTGGGTREKLRRVLRAFAVYNRRVSYCQGMNFVALALLEACSGDDENAFLVLAGMCDFLDLEGLWCQGLERLDLCFFSLDRLLSRHCPSLRQHLADEGVELNMFTSRWFVTLFTCTDVFGRATSRKILDMLLVEGWPLVFKLALGVLLEMRPLLEPADMEGILKVTKFPRAHLFGLRRDGTGRRVAGASFEEATQGSLCESIRAGQMVEHALLLHISEETLEQHLLDYRLEKLPAPGSD